MQRTLSKQWGPYAPGTVVVDNLIDAGSSPGSIQVNAERMATLEETGYFEQAEAVRPIPGEVMTGGGDAEAPPLAPRMPHGPGTAGFLESRRSRERPVPGSDAQAHEPPPDDPAKKEP